MKTRKVTEKEFEAIKRGQIRCFDQFDFVNEEKTLAVVYQGGCFGVVNLKTGLGIEPKYEKIEYLGRGYFLCYKEGIYQLLTENGYSVGKAVFTTEEACRMYADFWVK